MESDIHLSTLIGDLVGSKRRADRRELQESLKVVLRQVNAQVDPLQPLELTVGDEFQGGFSTVAAAARVSLMIRLALLTRQEGADTRYGLGHGEVTIFDAARTPISQDGPGWWSAREAIDRAKRLADSPRTSFVRTCFGAPPEHGGPPGIAESAVEAFLMCRDATVDRMNARQRRLLLGLMEGTTQARLAADEGITQGAVSQSLRRSGAFALEAAHWSLDRVAA